MNHWHTHSVEELMETFHSSYQGLSQKEREIRLEQEGKNQLDPPTKENIVLRFLHLLKDPMIIVLLFAAFLSLWASGGEDILDATIILIIVLVNNFIALSQENHAEKALEALNNLTAPKAKVYQDGKEVEIPSENLVLGDVIALNTGDKVPADARLIHATSLLVEESAMTGESQAVEKQLISSLPEDTPMAEWSNTLLSGTLILGGNCKALVVATGMETEMGKIAQLLESAPEPVSPLQVKMAEVSKTLSILCLMVCAVMFGIGLIQGEDLLTMFMTAVALAVAAIPEGLPAVVSIVLALGMSRMAEKGAIVKKLPAVETLGSASVICSDKTGTLTQNKMSVEDYYVLSGTRRKDALHCALLCSNAQLSWKGGAPVASGSPTEAALALYAVREGIDRDSLWELLPKVEEIPFSSERKLMSTIHPSPQGGYLVFVKGAPDILVRQCTHTLKGSINGKDRQNILEKVEEMAKRSLRVIGVAQRTIAYIPPKLTPDAVEQGLTFLGLFGLIDPPRPESKEAVALCHKAGIRPVMMTGDHRSTAIAIAKELDIYRRGDWAITGNELDFMPQELLEEDIAQFSVFARVTPEHKMRIVQAWQKQGQIVAVTGDGVNDAPALKTADIGCAMGLSGTEVAKGASEMILTEDNFHTIVHAVEEGRGIYANIRKAIHYLLSCNIGEILAIFVATVFHFATMPLVPVQLLWLNLVTDTLPALALGVEPVEESLMSAPPREKSQGLFDQKFTKRLLWQGCMVGLLTLLAYALGYYVLSPSEELRGEMANTMAFATLTLSQLFHAFNVRSEEKSLLLLGMFSNPAMNKAFVLGLALQMAVLTIPALQVVFSVIPMEMAQWVTVFALAMMPLPICEVVKGKEYAKTVQGKRVLSKEEVKSQKLVVSHQEEEEVFLIEK
ncbi:MAG: calcium-translocating P-type ATPase, PMCA-type [Eubacteriales bacterium]